jgi:hypothetical protein
LHDAAGLDPSDEPTSDGRVGPAERTLGIGSYAELRDGTGAVLARLPNDTTSASPSIPDVIGALDQPFTTGSFTGTGDWRALASVDTRYPGLTLIVATPLGDLAESLRGLLVIEVIAAAVILALMTIGSWLILRRGLRPLEPTSVPAPAISGRVSARVDPLDVDLSALAADACSDAAITDPDRQITLDAPRPVTVAGVADDLRRAISDLVSNALHHTPSGTPIDISAVAIAHRALVIVRDHGPRLGPASGVDLSTVQAIAESHGGKASVADKPDGGAEFTIDLPLKSNLPPPLAGPPEA